MKILKLFFLFAGISFSLNLFSQEFDLSHDTYLVAFRDLSISKNAPVALYYAYHEGDEMILKLSTNKDKSIDEISIMQNSKTLFTATDFDPQKEIRLNIEETGVVELKFSKRSFSQDIELRLMRKAEYQDGRYKNTNIEQVKKYDTIVSAYQESRVVGYQEVREPVIFRVISDVDYESVKMSAKDIKLKAGKKNYVSITKPQDTIKSPNKEMVLVGYQVLITSKAGAESMWKAISIGVDVGCLAMGLFVPGGVAIGLGVETMFSMVAPQEGGEPVYYLIMGNKGELDKFMDSDPNTNPLVYESGLATGYSGNWMPMNEMYIGLQNLNTLAEVDVSVATYAIYQATTISEIAQDRIVIIPQTEPVEMTREVIRNTKTWIIPN